MSALSLMIYLFSVQAAETISRPPLVLGQGEQRVLKVPLVARYALSSDAIRVKLVDFSDSGSEKRTRATRLFVKGHQNGGGNLTLIFATGEVWSIPVSVMEWGEAHLPKGMLRALSNLEEVEVIAGATRATLRGTVTSHEELARIGHLRREFSDAIADETELAPPLRGLLEGEIRSVTEKYGLTLETKPELFVRGRVTYGQSSIVERALRAIYPSLLIELEDPKNLPTVYVRVFLVEVRSDRLMTLGLRLDPLLHQSAFQIENTLNAFSRRGELKVLARPELVLHSPGEAQLFSGGEIPIFAPRSLTAEWKPFGLDLKLKLVSSTQERLQLEIKTELSQIAPEHEENPTPMVRKSRMGTQVQARFGQPILLCGMLQETERRGSAGLPWISEIPILGHLFGVHGTERQETEVAVILVPSRNVPIPDPQDEIPVPRGRFPTARNWIRPSEIRQTLESPEYPWNAF